MRLIYSFTLNILFCSTFNRQILIPDQITRKLLCTFSSEGLSTEDMALMTNKLTVFAPAVLPLVNSAAITQKAPGPKEPGKFVCQVRWKEFLRSLSSASPVCALIHPSSRASTLISSMIKDADITKDVEKMKVLQQEIPVIFELIRSLC